MNRLTQTGMLFAMLMFSARAEVIVQDPWVRASVPQQKVTGAFMKITSTTDARLVGIKSPVADSAEIHEMMMENGIMKMRAVPQLDLAAGKSLELKPGGGYHVMLFGLHRQVQAGDSVPLTLIIEDAGKQRLSVPIKATVKSLAAH